MPKKKVSYGDNYCESHDGQFDDFDRPLDEYGKPYMPGARVCKHKDCVRFEHVISAVQMEWLDISYRTKQKLDHQALFARIVSER